jgi:hypothetical protein
MPKPRQKGGKCKYCHGCLQRSVRATSIGHALELVRTVAEAMEAHPARSFLSGRARCMGRKYLHVIARCSCSFRNPSHERSRGIARKTGIVVGDGQDTKRLIG